MGVGLISFCSFLSGVGSCAAFQAALKTGSLPLVDSPRTCIDGISNTQLARSPWIGHGMSAGCFRAECIFLHAHCRHRVSGKHVRAAHNAFFCNLASRTCVDTLPYRCRSPAWRWLCSRTY